MFPPPQLLGTELFARVPDSLRRPGRPSWMQRHHRHAIDCFLEGLGFDRDGNLYVTELAHGRIFRLSSAGEFSVAAEYDGRPNGLALTRDESAVLLAVTRANAIWHVPLVGDDRVAGRVGTFIQMSGGSGRGPDGILLDSEENLVVAHARMGAVWVFSRLGEPVYRLRSCQGVMTTNIALGGSDLRTLYITESAGGCILTAKLPAPGRTPAWKG